MCKQKQIPYVGITVVPNRYEMMDCGQLCEKCSRLLNAHTIDNS